MKLASKMSEMKDLPNPPIDIGLPSYTMALAADEERLQTMRLTTIKRYLCLSPLVILLAMPLAAATARIYVVNKGGTTIDVIDPETNKVVKVIEDIESPEVARFSPDGSRIYITSGSENVLAVMDRKSGKYIKKVPLSGWANDVAVTKDGKLILVCIRSLPGGLDIVDAASLETVKTIPTGAG